jgi:hypothetical protein
MMFPLLRRTAAVPLLFASSAVALPSLGCCRSGAASSADDRSSRLPAVEDDESESARAPRFCDGSMGQHLPFTPHLLAFSPACLRRGMWH